MSIVTFNKISQNGIMYLLSKIGRQETLATLAPARSAGEVFIILNVYP
jgi:hypothetical protein